MDAADLRIFAAVARTGSMSKAAERLDTKVPGLLRQVADAASALTAPSAGTLESQKIQELL